MIKLYLQKQDDDNVLIGDEFFDIPLYPKRDWDVVPEETHSTEIETIKGEFQIEERPYNFHVLKETTLDYCQKNGRRISFLPPLRSHIVFCWAIPTELNLQKFLQIITKYNDQIKFVRMIYTMDSLNSPIPAYYSVILYFKGQVAADNFFQEFNCETIGENGEALYLLFVSKVHFISQDFKTCVKEEIISLDACVELPKCPVCVERLDGSITGISFEMMKKELPYDDEERWRKARETCITCQKIKKYSFGTPSNLKLLDKNEFDEIEERKLSETKIDKKRGKTGASCEICTEDQVSWICLICGHIGCGRYSSGHAKDHSIASRHAFCLELETLRIWDYLQDTYVHRIVRSREHLLLSLPDTGDSGNSVNEKIFKERMDMIIWEYNYLLGTQLEEQRKYYEEKLASLKKNKEDSPRLRQNEERIKQLKLEREALLNKTEEQGKEGKMFCKKVKMVKDKTVSLQSEIDQLKVFNQSIQENLQHFNQEKQEEIKSTPEIEREKEKLRLLQEKLESLFSKLDD